LPYDSEFLDSFAVSAHCRTVKEIIPVLWKAPSSPWLKVNIDGSVLTGYAACGGLFRDSRGFFLDAFSCNIGVASVFHYEVPAFILTMEHPTLHEWQNVWLESDSTSALLIFFEPFLNPIFASKQMA